MIDPRTLSPEPALLTTARLRMRGLRDDDAAALFAIFADAETMRYWSSPPHATIDVTRALIADVRARCAAARGLEWAITEADSDVAIGKIGHWQWQEKHSRSEVGFILRRDYWRRGLAVEALTEVVRYGVTTVGLHSMEAQLDAANSGSARTLERVGFRREGCTRESYFDGTRHIDTLIYGLLAREFVAGRP
jgi:[ribosomal protein S5]-alanine N-acetyltransferase